MKTAKAVTAFMIGIVGQAITLGLVPDKWRPLAESIVLAGITYGVYKIPNKTAPQESPKGRPKEG